MDTENRTWTETEIEWLSELQRELNVKRGKKELNVKIAIRLGYTENREIMYMKAEIFDSKSGKRLGEITRTAEDSTLSVVHLEKLMDFYDSVINELINGNTPRKANSRIDRWL